MNDQQTSTSPKLPWYSLNLRALKRSRVFHVALITLVVMSFSVVPLWRLLWFFPVYSFGNFRRIADAHGKKVAAWRWVEGKEIKIYYLPGIQPDSANEAASGVKELLSDTGLNLQVTVQPATKEILSAFESSLVEKKVHGSQTQCVSFKKLAAHLSELKDTHPHANILIVDTPIAEYWWAQGMAVFSHGLAVLEAGSLTPHLAKHESAHLLGYVMHDSFPLFVFGYPWEGWPTNRDTLMMLYTSSNTLSPRARDAILSFWRGIEKRTGQKYIQ